MTLADEATNPRRYGHGPSPTTFLARRSRSPTGPEFSEGGTSEGMHYCTYALRTMLHAGHDRAVSHHHHLRRCRRRHAHSLTASSQYIATATQTQQRMPVGEALRGGSLPEGELARGTRQGPSALQSIHSPITRLRRHRLLGREAEEG